MADIKRYAAKQTQIQPTPPPQRYVSFLSFVPHNAHTSLKSLISPACLCPHLNLGYERAGAIQILSFLMVFFRH